MTSGQRLKIGLLYEELQRATEEIHRIPVDCGNMVVFHSRIADDLDRRFASVVVDDVGPVKDLTDGNLCQQYGLSCGSSKMASDLLSAVLCRYGREGVYFRAGQAGIVAILAKAARYQQLRILTCLEARRLSQQTRKDFDPSIEQPRPFPDKHADTVQRLLSNIIRWNYPGIECGSPSESLLFQGST